MFRLIQTKPFAKAYQQLVAKNRILRTKVDSVLEALSEDPHQPKLRTHKVNLSEVGVVYSSRITGDLRVLWEYQKNSEVLILLLKLGGHSGQRGVYK